MDKKTYLIYAAALGLLLCSAALIYIFAGRDSWVCEQGSWIKRGITFLPKPDEPCERQETVASFEECVQAGNPVMESYPRQCRIASGAMFVEEIEEPGKPENPVIIDSPQPGAKVNNPLRIKGRARGSWYFEASFPAKLYDAAGSLLAEIPVTAQGDWMTEDFVPFSSEMSFTVPSTATGTLVLEKDNPSGLPEQADEVRVPVVFEFAPDPQMVIKAYFSNNQLDPEISCIKVFPVERSIPATEAVARAALQELLKGPTAAEQAAGYYSSINSGVDLLDLAIEDGVAKADFSERMEYQMGGSCRVSAIRSQIAETLKQFPTVREVVISVNGRTEDVLQP